MNIQTVENIIDELINDKNKKPRKMLRNRKTLFVNYGHVIFHCEFKDNELNFYFAITSKTKTFTENDFDFLETQITPAIVPIKGFNIWKVTFDYIPQNENDLENTLKQIIENYS